jgi:ferric-dicitrate binding protein FerR (iron transport regulator)
MKVVKRADGVLAYVKDGRSAGSGQPLYNKVSTPNGGQYQVVLQDGSKVWLNASSTLRFPTEFTGTHRNVEISGEAYFEIAKDPARPFKVSICSPAGVSTGQQVEVLGTSFNVMAYSDEKEIRTTLVDGSVKMKNASAEKVLEPGEQAQSSLNMPGLQIIRDADVAAAIAWKDGYFNFNKEDIQTIMRQLARWYDVEVGYVGTPNDRLFWGGMQRDLPLSSIFKILEKSGVQFNIEGKKVIVTL